MLDISRIATSFHSETSPEMRNLLERIRINGWRVRFYWGDPATGQDWDEEFGVAGRLGRSTGPKRVPILLHSRRCIGGGAILDHCIVRIRFANKKEGGDLYRHPNYHVKG